MCTLLRSLRQLNKWTQEDIALILGISSRTYHLKETGKNQFKVDEANKLLEFLWKEGLPITYEELFIHGVLKRGTSLS